MIIKHASYKNYKLFITTKTENPETKMYFQKENKRVVASKYWSDTRVFWGQNVESVHIISKFYHFLQKIFSPNKSIFTLKCWICQLSVCLHHWFLAQCRMSFCVHELHSISLLCCANKTKCVKTVHVLSCGLK